MKTLWTIARFLFFVLMCSIFYFCGKDTGKIEGRKQQLAEDREIPHQDATKPVWQCVYGCGNPTQSNVQIWRSYCETNGSGMNVDGTLYCFEEKDIPK